MHQKLASRGFLYFAYLCAFAMFDSALMYDFADHIPSFQRSTMANRKEASLQGQTLAPASPAAPRSTRQELIPVPSQRTTPTAAKTAKKAGRVTKAKATRKTANKAPSKKSKAKASPWEI